MNVSSKKAETVLFPEKETISGFPYKSHESINESPGSLLTQTRCRLFLQTAYHYISTFLIINPIPYCIKNHFVLMLASWKYKKNMF